MRITQGLENELNMLAVMIARGQGTALREHLDGLGLEQRIQLLHDLSRRTRLMHSADKTLSVMRVFVEGSSLGDRKLDPAKRFLEIRFSREVMRLMEGEWVYLERVFPYDSNVHREIRYRDIGPSTFSF